MPAMSATRPVTGAEKAADGPAGHRQRRRAGRPDLRAAARRPMGPRVAIRVYNGRWKQDGRPGGVEGHAEGNVRRQQVVTIQSRQYLKLPAEVQDHLFTPGSLHRDVAEGPGLDRRRRPAQHPDRLHRGSAARPGERASGPASSWSRAIRRGGGPRRDRRAARARDLRGQPLAHPRAFQAASSAPPTHPCTGSTASSSHDMVLGLRVKSELPDPMAVLLTVAQNRFLLNSLHGEGFLNMRLTDAEAKEAVGHQPGPARCSRSAFRPSPACWSCGPTASSLRHASTPCSCPPC